MQVLQYYRVQSCLKKIIYFDLLLTQLCFFVFLGTKTHEDGRRPIIILDSEGIVFFLSIWSYLSSRFCCKLMPIESTPTVLLIFITLLYTTLPDNETESHYCVVVVGSVCGGWGGEIDT